MVSTFQTRADLLVQAADGNIVAIVEVKNLEGLTAEIAATVRRNLVAPGRADWWSPYFMVVSQETGFLWDQRTLPPDPAPLPTTEFPMAPVVEHYLPSFVGGPRLRGSQLELAVQQWLSDLAWNAEDRPRAPDATLARTGFMELVRGGRVSSEIAL
jgi:hypothetical protein